MNTDDVVSQSAHRLASEAAEQMPRCWPRSVEIDTVVMSASQFIARSGIDMRKDDAKKLSEFRVALHSVIDPATHRILGVHLECFPRNEIRNGSRRHVFKLDNILRWCCADTPVN